MRIKLEDERHALAAFVKKFDQLGLGGLVIPPSKLNPPMPTPGGAAALFAQRQKKVSQLKEHSMAPLVEAESPVRLANEPIHKSLLEEEWEEGEDIDVSIELEKSALNISPSKAGLAAAVAARKGSQSPIREILGEKENLPV